MAEKEEATVTKEDYELIKMHFESEKSRFESEKARFESQIAKRNIFLSSITLATSSGGAIFALFTFLAKYLGEN